MDDPKPKRTYKVTLLYRKLLRRTDFFSEKRIPLPVPEFYEFYCGPKDQPPESTLCLSESFPKDIPFAPPLELVVTRFNIRYNEAEDVPHFCKWGCNISEQAVSISPASLKRQLEDFAYGKI